MKPRDIAGVAVKRRRGVEVGSASHRVTRVDRERSFSPHPGPLPRGLSLPTSLIGEIGQGQRPVIIPAWANGPGPRRLRRSGLKARSSDGPQVPSSQRMRPGFQPCPCPGPVPGPLAQAGMERAVGAAEADHWWVTASPPGEGAIAPTVEKNTPGTALLRVGNRFSLSPGERAGVRGKEPLVSPRSKKVECAAQMISLPSWRCPLFLTIHLAPLTSFAWAR